MSISVYLGSLLRNVIKLTEDFFIWRI